MHLKIGTKIIKKTNTNKLNYKIMSKLNIITERFLTKTTKEFINGETYVKIEEIKDAQLRKKWYNVVWHNKPNEKKLVIDCFKFLYQIKSKTYKNEKEAIQHFNQIIKSQIQ